MITFKDFFENSIREKKKTIDFLCEDIAINIGVRERINNPKTIFIVETIIKDERDYIYVLSEEIKQQRDIIKNGYR